MITAGKFEGQSDSLSIIHCYYNYIHRSMADDVNTLSVAAVLQYFVILVACQMLLITRKKQSG